MYKGELETFLEEKGFIIREGKEDFRLSSGWCGPYEIVHGDRSLKEKIQPEIKKTFEDVEGLYVYLKGDKILYVGKGKPIWARVWSHFRESFEVVGGDRLKIWHQFFKNKTHCGEVRVYWKELKDEKMRIIVEKMLAYVLNPEFVSFYESKKQKSRTTPTRDK
jgi:hypothetical protein